MGDRPPCSAAQAYEQAHEAIEAARTIRRRSEQLRRELDHLAGEAREERARLTPQNEAVLRALLGSPPADDPECA